MSKTIGLGAFALVAKVNANLADMGLTDENCAIVYEAEGNYKSWSPEGDINAITAIVKGKGYLMITKAGMDVSNWFDPDATAKELILYNNTTGGMIMQLLDSDNHLVVSVSSAVASHQVGAIPQSLFTANPTAVSFSLKSQSGMVNILLTSIFKTAPDDANYAIIRDEALIVGTTDGITGQLVSAARLNNGNVVLLVDNA